MGAHVVLPEVSVAVPAVSGLHPWQRFLFDCPPCRHWRDAHALLASAAWSEGPLAADAVVDGFAAGAAPDEGGHGGSLARRAGWREWARAERGAFFGLLRVRISDSVPARGR